MKKILLLSVSILFFVFSSKAQCNADFSYEYTSGGWTLEITDQSTATPPATVTSWSWEVDGSFFSSNQNITINNGGTHYVCLTIETSDGCSSTTCDTVSDADPCQTYNVSVWSEDETYLGNDGQVFAEVLSGTSPYNYDWSNGSSTNTSNSIDSITNLNAGTYSVTVEDANNCIFIDTVTVLLDTSCNLFLDVVLIDELCTADGLIEITPFNTHGNVTYNWSNGETTQNIYNLIPGNYSVTVEDDAGCIITQTYTVGRDISVPGQINECAGYDSAQVVNIDYTTATTANVTWAFYNSSGIPTYYTTEYTGLCNDCYILEVRIWSASCPETPDYFVTDTICTDNLPTSITNPIDNMSYINVYPNPVKDVLNIEFNSKENDLINIQIFSNTGQVISNININSYAGNNSVSIATNDLKQGIYFVRINNKTIKFVK